MTTNKIPGLFQVSGNYEDTEAAKKQWTQAILRTVRPMDSIRQPYLYLTQGWVNALRNDDHDRTDRQMLSTATDTRGIWTHWVISLFGLVFHRDHTLETKWLSFGLYPELRLTNRNTATH